MPPAAMPPDAVMSAAQVMLPVTASVEESVAAPVTASVEDSVAAPVTPSVPAAVRFLAAQSTVDLLDKAYLYHLRLKI